MSRCVLLIEDDTTMADYIARGLGEAGYAVERCGTGRDGLFRATDGGFDLVILDRMLPELDGLSVLRSMRAAGIRTPVLMLTALGSVDERVRGLREGADDYLAKPFSFAELAARAEALLRRPAETRDETVLACADLRVDLATRRATRGSREIALRPREFQMLAYLLQRKGRVVTRTMLLEALWDYHFDPQTNVIEVHISKLRKKIDGPGEPPLIRTVRGAGYKIDEPG
ncbi:winged helix-turn-helix domain-containing protein [Paralimibaculum aggregatum]|uniref:Winged helix-turn-helix domain-containing protein n=1 Tax=Paralimibaculum aggregatum TaxID=3036245 RepID=A0ABQ6LED1_9RHOB|nr:response regulator transcription factor [Limibaculum sp. NKW23]GMG81709.1 winged helix-turn-helix domain-containing protein [Limibaculum sp. NKW23]